MRLHRPELHRINRVLIMSNSDLVAASRPKAPVRVRQ